MSLFAHLAACTSSKVNKTFYSNPIVVLPSKVKGESIDDFREAYAWMNFNLPMNSRIAAWWITAIKWRMTSNMITYCDNYTGDFEQIGKIAHFFCLGEKKRGNLEGKCKFNSNGCIGGVVGFSADDLESCIGISQIAKHFYPQSSFDAVSSLMWKLAYHEMHRILAEAPKNSLSHFQKYLAVKISLFVIYSLKNSP